MLLLYGVQVTESCSSSGVPRAEYVGPHAGRGSGVGLRGPQRQGRSMGASLRSSREVRCAVPCRRFICFLGSSFIERGLCKPELSLPDIQFGPVTFFIERGRDGWPIQICFSAPLLLADAKCGQPTPADITRNRTYCRCELTWPVANEDVAAQEASAIWPS